MSNTQQVGTEVPDFAKIMLNEMAEQRNNALNELVSAKAALVTADKIINDLRTQLEQEKQDKNTPSANPKE